MGRERQGGPDLSIAAVWAKFKEVVTSPQVFLARLRNDQARQRETMQADDSELRDLEGLIAEQTDQLRVAAGRVHLSLK
jgi:hypothetical protein